MDVSTVDLINSWSSFLFFNRDCELEAESFLPNLLLIHDWFQALPNFTMSLLEFTWWWNPCSLWANEVSEEICNNSYKVRLVLVIFASCYVSMFFFIPHHQQQSRQEALCVQVVHTSVSPILVNTISKEQPKNVFKMSTWIQRWTDWILGARGQRSRSLWPHGISI